MGLKHAFSRRFNRGASSSDLSTSSTYSNRPNASHNATPSSLGVVDEDEQFIVAVELSSLRDQLDRSQNQVSTLLAETQRLEAQVEFERRNHQDDAGNNQDIIASLTRRNEFLEGQEQGFRDALDRAKRQSYLAEQEKSDLQTRVHSLSEEIGQFRAWAVRVSEKQRGAEELEARVRAAEEQNAWLLHQASKEVKEIFDEKLRFASREKELKELFEAFKKEQTKRVADAELEFAKKVSEYEDMSEKAKIAEGSVAILAAQLEESENQSAALRFALERAELNAAKLAAESKGLLGMAITPRLVLTLSLMQSRFKTSEPGSITAARQFLQSCSTRMLTSEMLDLSLTADQSTRFAECVTQDTSLHQSIFLRLCTVCENPRLMSSARISEFPSASSGFSCCPGTVCSSCLRSGITASIKQGWWSNLGSSAWLVCPSTTCTRSLDIRHPGQLAGKLRAIGIGQADIDELVLTYEKALAFRTALSGLNYAPGEEALSISRRLHQQLFSTGRMKSLFDPCFNSTEPGEDGRLPPFNTGRIKVLDVEVTGDGGQTRSVPVPIFTRFFTRRQMDCAVCSETLAEIDYGDSVQAWRDFCTGYPGPWMWDILLFPLGLVDRCETGHEADICRDCLSTHLSSQLEQFGRDHCDKLSCPSFGCGRKLTHREVQMFADRETFERYDRFQLLNNLSNEPNFRWCLREGCDSGQLYDDDEVDPEISCEACGFDMCFKHQMPWHEGLTCRQYDNERSEDFLAASRWIQENSKKCPGPGCGVNIVKGNQCFHMTCTRCSFEFCWVCLADWSRIRTRQGYRRDAHNDGCWFRTSNIEPTQVFGEEIEAAAARRRRGIGN